MSEPMFTAEQMNKLKNAMSRVSSQGPASVSTAPAEIESRVRIMDNVIRYLCVRLDEA